MGNAKQENKRVKKSITEALFLLMKKKPFSEISVTDIVTVAGVARASYYRNFNSLEEIIDYFVEDLHNEISFTGSIQITEDYVSRDIFIKLCENALTQVLSKKSYILALVDNGFSSRLQSIADVYIENVAGDMRYNSVNKYILYCLSGAIMNMLIHWLRDGAEESPHEVGTVFSYYFLHGILELLPLHWASDHAK